MNQLPHRYPHLNKPTYEPSSTHRAHYRSEEQDYCNYQKAYPKTGFLKVQTTIANGTFPISDVTVEVSKTFPTGRYVINTQMTDISGLTQPISLPAPPALISLTPGIKEPFASYDITLTHPKYTTVRIHNVPIYENQTTLQPVDLIPKTLTPEGQTVIEYTINPPVI